MTTKKEKNTQFVNPTQVPQVLHAYAVTCCKNGLLEKLPELSFNNPETVAEAFLATLIAQPKNTQSILTYLWEVDPHVSWDTQPILSRVAIAAPELARKIFVHAFETQPQQLRTAAQNIAYRALRFEDTNLLKVVSPYLRPSVLEDMIKDTCEKKQLPLVKTLVEAYPLERSPDFLKNLYPAHSQEAEYVLSIMESCRILSSLNDIPESRSKSAPRKI